MFSPENFYFVMRENHVQGRQSKMRIPRFNGQKSLGDFVIYFSDDSESQQYQDLDLAQKSAYQHIWMYDQEPVDAYAVDIYRRGLLDSTELRYHTQISQTPWTVLAAVMGRSTSAPIWCHSELNSQEISALEDQKFFTCYYWYHAFVSREWYRFWQYNQSLQPRDKHHVPYRFLLYARAFDGTRAYRQTLIDGLSSVKDSVLYDWHADRYVDATYSAKIDTQDASDSAIQLVAETLFDTKKIYLTEKVFKPMVMSQAFVIWGPPGTLSTLRDYGFQTFDGIWSEAYDTEHDSERRMTMLIDLVKGLASLSQEDFQIVYNKCLPIIQHNRDWFYSSWFMDRCWHELQINFAKAQEQSRAWLLTNPGGQMRCVLDSNPGLSEIPSIRAWAEQSISGR